MTKRVGKATEKTNRMYEASVLRLDHDTLFL
jgi:hypothetical protein